MITTSQLRQKYLDFFKSKEHAIIAPASLIPENDPTVLFTTAGMHPLVPFLMGEKHPEGNRLANVQKCVRTGDINEVGDSSHGTFFEMLGNWSLGDYFKEESIKMSWEFLTASDWLGLDPQKIAITVFKGDKDIEKDEESAKIWMDIGIEKNRIAYMPKENNWWGPAGITGPCGPDTEVFYYVGSGTPSEDSNPATDEDNWLEIWNNVFMEYDKQVDGSYKKLEQKNVDTGMGLERTVMVLNGMSDIFQIDTFWPLIQKIEEISGKEYIENQAIKKSMRIIADHVRTATMIIGDQRGVAPSNVDQGYIVRRLLRRAIRQAHSIGIAENFTSRLADKIIEIFGEIYSEIKKNKEFVLTEIAKEESKFRNTLEKGLVEFEKINSSTQNNTISGKDAFDLYQSYGFPLEMTTELAAEKNIDVDEDEFNIEMKKHQEISRLGAEKKFKGGLEDDGEMSKKYHTATHLMHAALRKILGEHVEQRGSNITSERLRFDFSHPEKLSIEQKEQVEELVNYAIDNDYIISCSEMTVAKAKEKGAIGLFEDKYGSKVKVFAVGDPSGLPDARVGSSTFSMEICGGPHVEKTGVLGKFRIKKEQASSSGVRRIKAVLE